MPHVLASLDNTLKAAQLKITARIFQGVPHLSSFVYLIYLVEVVSVPLTEAKIIILQEVPPRSSFFFSARFTPLSESAITRATKK